MAAVTAVTAPYGLRFDAGRICLDLLATAHPGEHLGSLPALRAWITGAHLVPPGTSLTHADASWPPRFRELRYAIDRLVRTQLAAGTVDTRPCDLALARVNALARPAPPAPRAVRGGDGTLVRVAGRPARVHGAARGRGTGRGGPAHRPGHPVRAAPVRGRQLPDRLPGHLAGPAQALVLQRGVRQPGAGRPSPPPRGPRPRGPLNHRGTHVCRTSRWRRTSRRSHAGGRPRRAGRRCPGTSSCRPVRGAHSGRPPDRRDRPPIPLNIPARASVPVPERATEGAAGHRRWAWARMRPWRGSVGPGPGDACPCPPRSPTRS